MKMVLKNKFLIGILIILLTIGAIGYYNIPSSNRYYHRNQVMADMLVSRYVYTQLFSKDYPNVYSTRYEVLQYNSGVVVKIIFDNKEKEYYLNNNKLKEIIYGE